MLQLIFGLIGKYWEYQIARLIEYRSVGVPKGERRKYNVTTVWCRIASAASSTSSIVHNKSLLVHGRGPSVRENYRFLASTCVDNSKKLTWTTIWKVNRPINVFFFSRKISCGNNVFVHANEGSSIGQEERSTSEARRLSASGFSDFPCFAVGKCMMLRNIHVLFLLRTTHNYTSIQSSKVL